MEGCRNLCSGLILYIKKCTSNCDELLFINYFRVQKVYLRETFRRSVHLLQLISGQRGEDLLHQTLSGEFNFCFYYSDIIICVIPRKFTSFVNQILSIYIHMSLYCNNIYNHISACHTYTKNILQM